MDLLATKFGTLHTNSYGHGHMPWIFHYLVFITALCEVNVCQVSKFQWIACIICAHRLIFAMGIRCVCAHLSSQSLKFEGVCIFKMLFCTIKCSNCVILPIVSFTSLNITKPLIFQRLHVIFFLCFFIYLFQTKLKIINYRVQVNRESIVWIMQEKRADADGHHAKWANAKQIHVIMPL